MHEELSHMPHATCQEPDLSLFRVCPNFVTEEAIQTCFVWVAVMELHPICRGNHQIVYIKEIKDSPQWYRKKNERTIAFSRSSILCYIFPARIFGLFKPPGPLEAVWNNLTLFIIPDLFAPTWGQNLSKLKNIVPTPVLRIPNIKFRFSIFH